MWCPVHGGTMLERLQYMIKTYRRMEEWICCSPDVGIIWDNTRTAILQANSTGLAALLTSAEVRTPPEPTPILNTQATGRVISLLAVANAFMPYRKTSLHYIHPLVQPQFAPCIAFVSP
jgi:hypothetical protein